MKGTSNEPNRLLVAEESCVRAEQENFEAPVKITRNLRIIESVCSEEYLNDANRFALLEPHDKPDADYNNKSALAPAPVLSTRLRNNAIVR